MRKYLLLSLMALLPMTALITVTSCGGGDEVVQPPVDNNANNDKDNPSGNDKDNPSGNNGENLDIHVIVNDDGTTSNGSIFSAIDNQNFYVDYIKYTVTEGYLTVSGYDKTGFKGIAKIISKLTYKGNTYEVLEIGYMVFYNCTSLTSITIPNSVTSIGSRAFESCSGLTSITIPNSVTSIGGYTFRDCSSLTSVTIPNSVTSIGYSAFEGCSSMTSVTIPNSVTSIGGGVFEGCSSLTSIIIPNSVTSIGYSAFEGTAWYNNQPDGLVYAGKVAYKYKGTMPEGTDIVIEDGTFGIASNAFSGCTSLTSVTIPNSVTSIDGDAFSGCSSLTSVTFQMA